MHSGEKADVPAGHVATTGLMVRTAIMSGSSIAYVPITRYPAVASGLMFGVVLGVIAER